MAGPRNRERRGRSQLTVAFQRGEESFEALRVEPGHGPHVEPVEPHLLRFLGRDHVADYVLLLVVTTLVHVPPHLEQTRRMNNQNWPVILKTT